MCDPWEKFGQKMKNFEIFFDIIDIYACLVFAVGRQKTTDFSTFRPTFSVKLSSNSDKQYV